MSPEPTTTADPIAVSATTVDDGDQLRHSGTALDRASGECVGRFGLVPSDNATFEIGYRLEIRSADGDAPEVWAIARRIEVERRHSV